MAESKFPDGETNLVGSYVRSRRKARGMTQSELAALAGVGLRFVVNLERGKRTVRMDTVNAVLRVFGKALGVVNLPRRSEPPPEAP